MIKDKHIDIYDKKQCSGCSACANVCPQSCITMQEDYEGFLYPKVDVLSCISCSKCLKVCPYTNSEFTLKPVTEELSLCYAAYNKNEEIRYKSSSGGMFRVFADKIIAEGGVVFGAAFDKNFTVYHTYTETLEGLSAFMGSKYMQSRIENSFSLVNQFLKEGRNVLFSGCACQISGLKRYLKDDYEKLICVDILCHGVASPKIWKNYLDNYFSFDIKSISFRDKKYGWSKSSYKITGVNNSYSEIVHQNIFHQNYIKNLFNRPACSVCPFKNDNRVSDITIADCWGFFKIAPEMNDEKGLSSVIIHTDKGRTHFNAIAEQIIVKETYIDDVKELNPDYLRSQLVDNRKREQFWKDYSSITFKVLFEKYSKNTNKNKAILHIKQIAKKIIPSRIIQILKHLYPIKKNKINSAKSIIAADKQFNETFRFNGKEMPKYFKSQPEWKFIVTYRKYQANKDNIFGLFYSFKLDKIERKTGIHIEKNPNFGRGLIIGHYGRIIINGNVKFGEQIYITHGVTIGQNSVGKRKGTPIIGNRVRIGANATIVGKVNIGNDVLIAPNTFVNIDIPDHSVVVGNPCTIYKKEDATKGYLGTID